MKRVLAIMLIAVVLGVLPGCGDEIVLEDISIGLILGIDLDEQNKLVFYISNPIFSPEARKRSEEYHDHAVSLRDAREKLDSKTPGYLVGGKFQVLLLGRKLLEHEEWFPLLDLVYRESKFSVNARVVAVQGPVAEVMSYKPADKPLLISFLPKLIDTANRRNITVKTTLQELHRQMLEKGMTASLTELSEKNPVEVTGTALLKENGVYTESLDLKESVLLLILSNKTKADLNVNIKIPSENKGELVDSGEMNLDPDSVKTSIRCFYEQGKFRFNFNVKIDTDLSERLFPYDMRSRREELQRAIEEQLQKQMERLIATFQKRQIDPLGLGLYARAHQYKAWKQVQDDWGKAFSEAEVNVKVQVQIRNMGTLK